MPLVLNQSHGAHDRSFPNSLLHSPSSTSPASSSSSRHRRTRSFQNQKPNRHHHSQSLPRIIDQLPPQHLNPNLAYAASVPPHYHILPALSSLHVAPPIAVEPIQVPSPISPEEMEHQRPRHPDDPIDDHEWASFHQTSNFPLFVESY